MAFISMIFAEIFFIVYPRYNDTYNLVGHIFKILVYFFVFRALFVSSILDSHHKLILSKEELQHNLKRMKEIVESTVQAIGMAVEVKDPYTMGHQRRVAKLATEIARFMMLPEHIVDSVSIASQLHDIGKISIPAEILSKPGQLNENEFNLIKAHPTTAYEILKIIEFSTPIARIVQQHHERLDGSGYPLGLSEEEIMLEAKIISVADVVEAMSSHRPYRPAMGIETALAEIALMRDKLYDSNVVDACLKLFIHHGFEFENVK